MARAPRASVSKTSGASISRGAYQKVYGMTRDKAPQVSGSTKFESGEREYRKGGKTKALETGKFNISYGDTFHPTDLEDVKALGEGKAPKSWNTSRKPSKIKGFK